MKIIAKQGSELEKLLKQMNERLLREQDEAKDMIQEYCGSRPDSIGYVLGVWLHCRVVLYTYRF